MSTILSRFDLIFIVRDIRDMERDRSIAKHVMGIHINTGAAQAAGGAAAAAADDENGLSVPLLKKYVSYCRARCKPRLSEEAIVTLRDSYVDMRARVAQRTAEIGEDTQAVPITVRQLEALVRISESLAKMRLASEVSPADCAEAIRLFRISTMQAATSGTAATDMSMLRPEVLEELNRAEEYLKSRFAIGVTMKVAALVDDAVRAGHKDAAVRRSMAVMIARDEAKERDQGKLLKRLK